MLAVCSQLGVAMRRLGEKIDLRCINAMSRHRVRSLSSSIWILRGIFIPSHNPTTVCKYHSHLKRMLSESSAVCECCGLLAGATSLPLVQSILRLRSPRIDECHPCHWHHPREDRLSRQGDGAPSCQSGSDEGAPGEANKLYCACAQGTG